MPNIQPQVELGFNHKLNFRLLDQTGHTNDSARMGKVIGLMGTRILKRLGDLGKNQGWLAENMGLSDEAVSKWIRGNSSPALENLLKMAKLLQCPVGYLCGDYSDESISEVARLMATASPEHREFILSTVSALLSSLPKHVSSAVKNHAN